MGVSFIYRGQRFESQAAVYIEKVHPFGEENCGFIAFCTRLYANSSDTLVQFALNPGPLKSNSIWKSNRNQVCL